MRISQIESINQKQPAAWRRRPSLHFCHLLSGAGLGVLAFSLIGHSAEAVKKAKRLNRSKEMGVAKQKGPVLPSTPVYFCLYLVCKIFRPLDNTLLPAPHLTQRFPKEEFQCQNLKAKLPLLPCTPSHLKDTRTCLKESC